MERVMEGGIDRRGFLRAGVAIASVAGVGRAFGALAGRSPLPKLAVRTIDVPVGAERPFELLHVSDTHLALCDVRNDDRKIKLAAWRAREMRLAAHYLGEAVAFARERGIALLHTGDMIDFTSEANYDAAADCFAGADFFVCAGNHEFSQYVGEAKEDAAYKAQSFAAVQANFPNDLSFASRVVNGVNFVAADNVYYNFTEAQLAQFEREVEKGLPIVFMCHVPLYAPGLFGRQMERTKGVAAYLCGAPDAEVARFAPSRAEQQRTDAPTREFIARLRGERLVKAVLCGHIHVPEGDALAPAVPMHVAGATYKGYAQLLRFV